MFKQKGSVHVILRCICATIDALEKQ